MIKEDTIIIGAGPCGLSCALEIQKKGGNPLIIEKGNLVNTIFNFPTHQTFFSSSKRLEIGDIPFVSDRFKPVRSEALAYYREVVRRNNIRINAFEEMISLKKQRDFVEVTTRRKDGDMIKYQAKDVIIATGYYDQPNLLEIPGENLAKVFHYFKEAHPYYDKEVVIIGGKNSSVDTALELHKAGAKVTVLYRGSAYSKSIKPWILPDFDGLIQNGDIQMVFNANVKEITENTVLYTVNDALYEIENDFVFAMTGYQPNIDMLREIGIHVDDKSGKPEINPKTFETNLKNIYIAGVVISGYNGNETFIENGRLHGAEIAKAIMNK